MHRMVEYLFIHSLCLHFTDEIGLHPSHKRDIGPSVKVQTCLPLSILLNLANTLSTRISFKHRMNISLNENYNKGHQLDQKTRLKVINDITQAGKFPCICL